MVLKIGGTAKTGFPAAATFFKVSHPPSSYKLCVLPNGAWLQWWAASIPNRTNRRKFWKAFQLKVALKQTAGWKLPHSCTGAPHFLHRSRGLGKLPLEKDLRNWWLISDSGNLLKDKKWEMGGSCVLKDSCAQPRSDIVSPIRLRCCHLHLRIDLVNGSTEPVRTAIRLEPNGSLHENEPNRRNRFAVRTDKMEPVLKKSGPRNRPVRTAFSNVAWRIKGSFPYRLGWRRFRPFMKQPPSHIATRPTFGGAPSQSNRHLAFSRRNSRPGTDKICQKTQKLPTVVLYAVKHMKNSRHFIDYVSCVKRCANSYDLFPKM